MALRSEELPARLESLSGLMTSHEAARYLQMTYWHFMHLVEANRIPGMRVVDRWLFAPADLDAYRRSRFGDLEDLARSALDRPGLLTEKQEVICKEIVAGKRPSEIARELHQSRQAVHAQIGLVRDKVGQSSQPGKARAENLPASTPNGHTSSPSPRASSPTSSPLRSPSSSPASTPSSARRSWKPTALTT